LSYNDVNTNHTGNIISIYHDSKSDGPSLCISKINAVGSVVYITPGGTNHITILDSGATMSVYIVVVSLPVLVSYRLFERENVNG
jgi:hypothetical protein